VIGIRAVRRGTIARKVRTSLPAGVRAGAGTVGYLGSQVALTVLSNNDPLPVGWSAVWDTGTLVVSGSNVTIDHYLINASVVFTGNNPTMTNCIVRCNPNDIFGVTINGTGRGVLNISDTTVIGDHTGVSAQVNGISSDSGLVARRCDVSQTGDGIHMVSQPNAADAIISQCYVHDQGFIDESQHCDGIQIFNGATTGTFTVEHSYVVRSVSTIGTPMNAAMTCGTPTNDSTPLATAIIDNTYFESGLYHLRLNFRLQNAVVTNNDIGPMHASEFGILSVEVPSAIATWTNNHDANGALIPNPYAPVTPVVRESLQTPNNQTTSQVLSTTGAVTANGDTLLVVYATDNNTASTPTSTAGTLTQIGTDTTDGNGNGIFRAYLVPVASDGSKTVTFPAAGGFDVMGAVIVIQGGATAEGFVTQNITSAIDHFTTPSITASGAVDLLVGGMYNGQGKTFDLSASGLTQRANPSALPFSAFSIGTAALTSAGASPTYDVTLDGEAKVGMFVFGLKQL
jgi:hypothetical protein